MNQITAVFMALIVLLLSGRGYNKYRTKDERIKAGWPEVIIQY